MSVPEPAPNSPPPARMALPRIALIFERAALALIAIGVLARLVRFAFNKPLWADEALVALMVVERSFAQLWTPQAHDPVSPVGFLWIVKASTVLFGEGEVALRLLPFAAGLASLGIFWGLVREALERDEARIAVLLFAVSEPLIFYTTELKQYSTDVLLALLIAWPALRMVRRGPTAARVRTLGVAVFLGCWLSLPVVFVAGGALAALASTLLTRTNGRPSLGAIGLGTLALAASFGAMYWTQLAPHTDNLVRAGHWGTFYAPLSLSPEDWLWYPQTYLAYFEDPLGLAAVWIAAPGFVFGAVLLWQRDRTLLTLLVVPTLLALVASALEIAPFATGKDNHLERYYPFFGRVILYSAPFSIAVLAVAVAFPLRRGDRTSLLVGMLAGAILFAAPVTRLFQNIIAPPLIQDLRTVAEEMRALAEPGDRVFSQSDSRPGVDYYMRRLALPKPTANLRLRRNEDAIPLRNQLASIPSGARFWFLSAHHPHWLSEAELPNLLAVFARRGVLLEERHAYRASAYLYRAY